MKFNAKLQFLNIEQKVIKDGKNAGKMYSQVKLFDIEDNEIFDISIFDNPILVDKLLKLEPHKEYNFVIRVKKSGYNAKLELIDKV